MLNGEVRSGGGAEIQVTATLEALDHSRSEWAAMNILYFLKERTNFIQQYYDVASEPFAEIIRKIEAGDEPYSTEIVDTFEDPEGFHFGNEPPELEPPFMEEWSRAYTSLEVLGLSCVLYVVSVPKTLLSNLGGRAWCDLAGW